MVLDFQQSGIKLTMVSKIFILVLLLVLMQGAQAGVAAYGTCVAACIAIHAPGGPVTVIAANAYCHQLCSWLLVVPGP